MKKKIKLVINKASSFVAPLFNQPKKHLKTWLVIFLALTAGLAAFFFLLSPRATEAAWWDETWLYRKAVQISNSNGADLTDFQVAITLDTVSLITAGKMQGDCDDLRITDQNGQILPHWIEENNPGCNNAATKVWVKIPTVHKGTNATTIYAYYGNAQAENAENGDNVFEFFDDFSTDTTENYIWSTVDTTSPVNSHNWNQENNWIEIRTGDNDAESPSKNINLPSSGHAQILMTKRLDYPSDNTQYLDIIQNSSNYYRFEWQGSAYSAQGVYKRVGGSIVDSSTESGTVNTDNAQYRIDMYWTPAKMILEIDGVERKNISTSNTTEIIPTSFLFYNSQINQDWELIFINKYAATDLTTSLNAEEISPGPVAYWKFDEGSGTTAHDSSGQGNHGTFLSAPIWKTEEFCISGKCLSFDNVDDGVSITNENFTFLTDYTMCSWVAPKGNHKNYTGPIISSGDWNNVHWAFGVNQDNTRIQTRKADGVNSPWWYYTFSLTDWSYICITRDGAIITAYANGKKVGSPYTGITGNLISNATNTTIGRATYTTYFAFNGLIDEVKIYHYARTADQIKSDYIAGASSKGSSAVFGHKTETAPITPLASRLVAYWKFDEGYGTTAHDSVGNNHGTLSGTTLPEWTNEGKVGKALKFNGVDNYLTANLNISPTETTVSFWLKNASYGAGPYLFRSNANTRTYIGIDGSNNLFFAKGNPYTSIASISNPTTNSWTHVLFKWWSNSGSLYGQAFINGKSINDPVFFEGTASGSYITLGGFSPTGGQNAAGIIDEVKIYNYALTPEEILQDYNQGMAAVMGQSSANTGSSASGGSAAQEYCVPGSTDYCAPPVAEWNFEENTGTTARDTSGNGNDGTLVNMDNSNWVAGANGSGAALSFDGSNEYVNSTIGQLNSFTISGWFKQNATGNQKWVGLAESSDNSKPSWIGSGNSGNNSTWDCGVNSTGINALDTTGTNWNHYVLIYNGTNAKCYRNGVLRGTTANTSFYYSNAKISIGKRAWDDTGFFNGLIDNVKIYNYARTPAQIAWDYNRGGPVGHWRFDECEGIVAHDVSGNENHGTINIGATAPQTSAGTCQIPGTAWGNGAAGRLNSAMSFDGVDDYAKVSDTTNNFDFGTGDFTLSAWIYKPSGGKGSPGIISKNGNPGYKFNLNANTGLYLGIYDGSWHDYVSVTSIVKNNSWQHVAITADRDGNVGYFVNGELKDTDNISGTALVSLSNSSSLLIGDDNWCRADYCGQFDGLIDDVQIFNYALTPLQIKTLYNNGAVRFGEQLKG